MKKTHWKFSFTVNQKYKNENIIFKIQFKLEIKFHKE